MNRFSILVFLMLVSVYPVFAQGKEYRLVWSDEFEVDGRPSKDWSYEHGFQRNQELQWYQSDNAYVKDG